MEKKNSLPEHVRAHNVRARNMHAACAQWRKQEFNFGWPRVNCIPFVRHNNWHNNNPQTKLASFDMVWHIWSGRPVSKLGFLFVLETGV